MNSVLYIRADKKLVNALKKSLTRYNLKHPGAELSMAAWVRKLLYKELLRNENFGYGVE